jgi:hypothetical protein
MMMTKMKTLQQLLLLLLLALLLLLSCPGATTARMMGIQIQQQSSVLEQQEMVTTTMTTTRQECRASGGIVVADVGDGSSRLPEYRCASNGQAIAAVIYTLPEEEPSDEGEVCCGGGSAAAAAAGAEQPRPTLTREECQQDARGGSIVGDIGNGAIFEPDYVCESNGQAPLGNIVDEPLAIDGEVCCGPPAAAAVPFAAALPEMTRDECLGISSTRTVVVADDDARGMCESSNGYKVEPLGSIVPPGFVGSELCCPLLEVPPGDTASPLLPFFTAEQCLSMNGEVVGDIGNGAIFEPDYVCKSSGKKPFAIIATFPFNEGAPVAVEGSVCCAPGNHNDEPPTMSRDECSQLGGLIIYDIGDGSSRRADYRCDSNGLGIVGLVVAMPGEPLSFEGEVCCGAASTEAAESPILESPSSPVLQLQEFTRQECLENSGVVVGDIGDGATRRDDFICDSSGEPILAIIVPIDGEPIAKDGEVCCGPMVVNRQECTTDLSGIIVSDVGDGSSRRPDYRCESSGEPILAIIVPAEGEPISDEGEVCCGPKIVNRQECTMELNGIIVHDVGDGSSRRPDYLCVGSGEPILAFIVPIEGEPLSEEGEVCCGAEPIIVNRQECTNDLDGIIVQDIGDGSSRRPGYLCQSSGEPILAIIVPAEGEPVAREGEVCCGAESGTEVLFPEMTRDECELEYDGVIVGDIGDRMTLRDDYLCITNGEPILGVIVSSSSPDEFIAVEGEVCCGLADSEDEVDERCKLFCQCSNSVSGWFRRHFGSD